MWRSFLARSQPLLSRLHPIRQPRARSYCNGDGRRPTVPSSSRGGHKHLYVALDDSNGYALHKLDVADLAGDDSDMEPDVATGGTEEPQPLPQPVLRLSFRSFGDGAQFSALGSKIVVTDCSRCDDGESSKHLTLVYDTKTAKQDICPFVPEGLTGGYSTVAVGHKLYAFSPHGLPLYYLRDARAHPETDDHDDAAAKSTSDEDDDTDKSESDEDDDTDESESDEDDDTDESKSDDIDKVGLNILRGRAEEQWTWKLSPTSIPSGTYYVTSGQAVHPDGRTIFLSTVDHNRRSTYSLDTDQPGGEWTRLGNWHLPFLCNYDRELDALVGIAYKEDTGTHHLCSCDLPATGANPTPKPARKLCKEKLTFMQSPLRSMCSTLVHTGCGRFCLVEVAPPICVSKARRYLDVDQDHLLQVTMFRAKYGKNGELMATPLRPGRLYRMSRYDPLSIGQPPAFWM